MMLRVFPGKKRMKEFPTADEILALTWNMILKKEHYRGDHYLIQSLKGIRGWDKPEYADDAHLIIAGLQLILLTREASCPQDKLVNGWKVTAQHVHHVPEGVQSDPVMESFSALLCDDVLHGCLLLNEKKKKRS